MGLLIVWYASLLGRHLCAVAGGADSSGYVNCAVRIHNGNLREPIKALELFGLGTKFAPAFRPLGFTLGTESNMRAPYYSPGLPFHMALMAGLIGWKMGPFLVSPLAALLGLLLMYLLARQFGLSLAYSLAAVFLLAAYPSYVFIAIQPMSDVLATLWVMVAILAAMRSRKKKAWALLSGAALGVSVLVRPANVLVLLPLLLALPWNPMVMLLFALGGLPFAIFTGIYNHALYGSPFTTGYRGEIPGNLALGYFPVRFKFYSRWLATSLTPLVPLAWLALPVDRKVAWKDRLLLFSWFVPIMLFYCIYLPYEGWWFTRFLLPGLPALILAALLLLRDGLEFLKPRIRPAGFWVHGLKIVACLLVGLVFTGEIRQIKRLGVWETDKYEAVYKDSCSYVRQNLPAKSFILSMQMGGAITYYTDFVPCRWDSLNPALFKVLRRKVESRGYQMFALLFPFEEEKFQAKTPGSWEKIQNIDFVSLWRLAPASRPRLHKIRGK